MALARNVFGAFHRNVFRAFLPDYVCPVLSVRHASRHRIPKWRTLRGQKFIKVDLPDFHEKDNEDLSKEEMRSKMKEHGVLPPRHWVERPMYISSSGGIFEAYVPPEGDGKVSIISKEGAKQSAVFLEKKGKSMMAIRKIRSFEEDFEMLEFLQEVQDIYIKSHSLLMEKDAEKLSEYVTERAIPEMMNNLKNKTFHWKFLESIEPPKLVHARTTEMITKTNIFAQLTVRFHTKQMLSIYDRFGRLMYGSDMVAKDVLEYIVFEKHIVNQYGKWRVHDKIIPDWMPVGEPTPKTFRVEEEVEESVARKQAKETEEIINRHLQKPL